MRIDGVEDVALRLRHLVAVAVAHESVDVHFAERHVAHELQPEHDHAGHPEEDDVEAGDQHRGRIERLQAVGAFRPAEGGERPQRRRIPRVEHIGVLLQSERCRQRELLADLGFAPAHVDVAVAVVPGGDPVPPPNLAADAPVLDVAHPFEVGLRPVLGDEADVAVLHGTNRRLGQRPRLHEPLIGEVGLDRRVGAVAPRHRHPVRLGAGEKAARLQVLDDPGPRLEAVEPPVALRRVVVDPRVRREDAHPREPVTFADLIVVEVVGRGDLDAPGAEFRIDHLVGDDGDAALGERKLDHRADERAVAVVAGVDGDRGVAEHRLGPGGCHLDVAAAVDQRVADVPQRTVLLLGDDLQVRHRGLQDGVPVDEALAAIDQALLVEAHEGLPHRRGEPLVHGEALVRPVDGCAHPPHLTGDGAARVLLPAPDSVHEGAPAERLAGQSLRVDLTLDHHLGRDARVIGARLPERRAPVHAVVADQRVHDRVLERVAHVQGAGHVGGRDHDAVRLRAGAGDEVSLPLPASVPALLYLMGVVGLVHGGLVDGAGVPQRWVFNSNPRLRYSR